MLGAGCSAERRKEGRKEGRTKETDNEKMNKKGRKHTKGGVGRNKNSSSSSLLLFYGWQTKGGGVETISLETCMPTKTFTEFVKGKAKVR